MTDDYDCMNERDKLPYRSNTDPQRMGEIEKVRAGLNRGKTATGVGVIVINISTAETCAKPGTASQNW